MLVASFALALAPAAGAATLGAREQALLDRMNDVRAARGLAPLRVDPRLVVAADAHSRALLRRDALSHGSLAQRLAAFRVRGPRVGENLAWGVGARASARRIVSSWLRSPGHRANLLRPGFRRVGIGAVTGRYAGIRGATVVTADFAGT